MSILGLYHQQKLQLRKFGVVREVVRGIPCGRQGILCGWNSMWIKISVNSLTDMSLIRIKIDLSDKYFYLTFF